jgi:Arc/MetJ family transcription regulator
MKVTVDIDDGLLAEAQHLSGIESTEAILHAAVQTLVARTVAVRLVALGGTERQLRRIRRSRG